MDEKTFKHDNNNDLTIKTHEDIVGIIQELKTFEERYKEYTITEPEYEQEIFEIDSETKEPIENEITEEINKGKLIKIFQKEGKIPDEKQTFTNIRGRGLFSKLPLNFLNRIKKTLHIFPNETSSEDKDSDKTTISSSVNTFKIRFNGEGKLDFLDMKKPKPKPNLKFDPKKIMGFIRKKGKEEKSSSTSDDENKSKISMIKDKISNIVNIKNISKLRDIIPFIGKNKE